MRGSCLAFRFSLADRAVILEQIQTSCKIMLQMAETTLLPSVGEYYKEIKTSCKCDRWQGFSGTQLSDSSSHLSGRWQRSLWSKQQAFIAGKEFTDHGSERWWTSQWEGSFLKKQKRWGKNPPNSQAVSFYAGLGGVGRGFGKETIDAYRDPTPVAGTVLTKSTSRCVSGCAPKGISLRHVALLQPLMFQG